MSLLPSAVSMRLSSPQQLQFMDRCSSYKEYLQTSFASLAAAPAEKMAAQRRPLWWPTVRQRGPLSMVHILKSCLLFALLFIILFVGYLRNVHHWHPSNAINIAVDGEPWLRFDKMSAYYHGLRVLVPSSQHVPEYPTPSHSFDPITNPSTRPAASSMRVPLVEYNPYPMYDSLTYLSDHHPVQMCYLNKEKTIPAPSIYAYDGIPQFQAQPVFGSYEVLGLEAGTCFDRFGRLGPYYFEYDLMEGGTKDNFYAPCEGNEAVCLQTSRISHWIFTKEGGMNWTEAQTECFESNKQRFIQHSTESPKSTRDTNEDKDTSLRKTLPRNALVLRCWVGYQWHEPAILNLRALVTELALNSGGEYTVHILLHVKDNQLAIWANPNLYRKVIEENVPREFWDLVTLWSEKYMEVIYSTPFGESFEVPATAGSVHGAYRSLHMPLQWFAYEHPQYDFFWNWEMDMRYSGHYYELLDRLDKWSRNEPREGLWERSAKYYIPALHGTWENFVELVRNETNTTSTESMDDGKWPGMPLDFPGRKWLPNERIKPPPGCAPSVDSSCGVGEPADLITFNPLFDPEDSGWVFRQDIIGYDKSFAIPPRRTAIITAGRLSKKLLAAMHDEMIYFGHSAFSEMWPPTTALHHGLKAVFAPHPVYFERKWPLEEVERHFNSGKDGSSGGNPNSPFNVHNEHNHKGTTWYYNADFSNQLWRRWLGFKVNDEGGMGFEQGISGTGRMCIRSMLFHPIKPEHEARD